MRLSAVSRLLEDTESFEVGIYGLPPALLNHPTLKVGRLIGWSPRGYIQVRCL